MFSAIGYLNMNAWAAGAAQTVRVLFDIWVNWQALSTELYSPTFDIDSDGKAFNIEECPTLRVQEEEESQGSCDSDFSDLHEPDACADIGRECFESDSEWHRCEEDYVIIEYSDSDDDGNYYCVPEDSNYCIPSESDSEQSCDGMIGFRMQEIELEYLNLPRIVAHSLVMPSFIYDLMSIWSYGDLIPT